MVQPCPCRSSSVWPSCPQSSSCESSASSTSLRCSASPLSAHTFTRWLLTPPSGDTCTAGTSQVSHAGRHTDRQNDRERDKIERQLLLLMAMFCYVTESDSDRPRDTDWKEVSLPGLHVWCPLLVTSPVPLPLCLSVNPSLCLSLSLSFSTSFTSGPLSYAVTCAAPDTAPCPPSTVIHATCCPTPLPSRWCRVSSAASTTSGPPCCKAFYPAPATTRWALWVTPTGCRRPLTCGLASRLRGEGAPTSAVASSEIDDFI